MINSAVRVQGEKLLWCLKMAVCSRVGDICNFCTTSSAYFTPQRHLRKYVTSLFSKSACSGVISFLNSFFFFGLHNLVRWFVTTLKRKRGTRWRIWLRHCATCRKIAGSIPDGVTGIFQWLNPSGRIVVLGSTQLLTEMSTRNLPWW
jgi:hypothetical protein